MFQQCTSDATAYDAPATLATKPQAPGVRAVANGVCMTLWSGDGLAAALTPATRDLLAQARPQIVQLHASPGELRAHAGYAAEIVRRLVPGVRLWIGVGCDGVGYKVFHGDMTPTDGAAELATVAAMAVLSGCEAVVWDAEGYEEAKPEPFAALARVLGPTVRASCPTLVQMHTAYDQLASWPKYPWVAWWDAVSVELRQVYSAAAMGRHGALQNRLARSDAQYAAAQATGRVPHHLEVALYVQAHDTYTPDLVSVGASARLVALWAFPGERDAAGAVALRALCELRRRGMDVRQFQASVPGLVVDGVCGPKTLAALGITTG